MDSKIKKHVHTVSPFRVCCSVQMLKSSLHMTNACVRTALLTEVVRLLSYLKNNLEIVLFLIFF